jgi:hypothetical protein
MDATGTVWLLLTGRFSCDNVLVGEESRVAPPRDYIESKDDFYKRYLCLSSRDSNSRGALI